MIGADPIWVGVSFDDQIRFGLLFMGLVLFHGWWAMGEDTYGTSGGVTRCKRNR